MPNWCINRLIVDGDRASLMEFRARAAGPGDFGDVPLDFNQFVPAPADLDDDALYDWRVDNWQTKWPADSEHFRVTQDDDLTMVFWTAWAPPAPVIRAASLDYPRLTFDLTYHDDEAPFAGRVRFRGGEAESDAFVSDDYAECRRFLMRAGWDDEARKYEELLAQDPDDYV
jgi:hypothetical protein